MAVDLDNPALGLPEARPCAQLALWVGLVNLAAGKGFEPQNGAVTLFTDLQSAAFDHSANPPKERTKASSSDLAIWSGWPFIFSNIYFYYAKLHRACQGQNVILHNRHSPEYNGFVEVHGLLLSSREELD